MSTTQTKALRPADEVKMNLERMSPQFKAALPSHIPVEKFVRIAQTAILSNPNLLKSDRASLYSACVKAAQAGLNCDGSEAALVPFKDQVQFMPMVSGLMKLVRNSGELSTIMSEIVYEKDVFKYWIDSSGQHINHEPLMFGDRGKAIGAYALAKLKDGSLYVEMMSEAQINQVRNVSKSKDFGPWSGAFVYEMWKKTVMRRLIKRLPRSTDLDFALKANDEDIMLPTESEAKPAEAKQKKSSRVKNLLDTAKENTSAQTDHSAEMKDVSMTAPSSEQSEQEQNHPQENNDSPI